MDSKSKKRHLFGLIQEIRSFFTNEGFLDVLTPPMVPNPGMETHIHPFEVFSTKDQKSKELYLHTSPEFYMKELLSEGFEKIFTLSYCFRDEPNSQTHRPQFLMLEWYRTGEHYTKIMDDCENLLAAVSKNKIQLERKTVSAIFQEVLNFDILDYLEQSSLHKYIQDNFQDIHLGPESHNELTWEDLFFLVFLNKIEPALKNYPALLLYEYPYQLSALSTIKENDSRVCERFEIYLNGIEICNCFNELRDLAIQKERFEKQAREKRNLYSYELPEPRILYSALEKGIPKSCGIALGVERLLMAISEIDNPFYD